ncbi:hypothetical protein OIU79_001953 [Salix purpurea]|uniref:Calmodulin-binding domain-containing protein n=1 Tax=Salix purpurea TaxID=77065 RepID=A0A9Q0ZHM0_SALPP|nr:hypothetical protein OIU79_001953 [Salix purpurea]
MHLKRRQGVPFLEGLYRNYKMTKFWQSLRQRTRVHQWLRSSLVPISKSPSANNPEIIKREASTKSAVIQTPLLKEVLTKRMTPTGLLAKSFDSQSSMLREALAKKKSSAGLPLAKSFDGRSPVSREVLAKKKSSAGLPLTKSFDGQSPVSREVLAKKKSSTGLPLTKSFDGQSPISREVVFKKMMMTQEVSTKSADSQGSGSSEIWMKTKTTANGKEEGFRAKEVKLSAKYTGTLNPKSSPPDASKVFGARRNGDIRIEQRKGTSKIGAKKLQASPRASFSPRRLKKVMLSSTRIRIPIRMPIMFNPLVNLKNPMVTQSREKTLYVIKMKADNKYVESDHNENVSVEASPPLLSSLKSPSLPKSLSSMSHSEKDEDGSEYTVTEAEDDTSSEYDETEFIEEAETLEAEHTGRNRKSGMVLSEEKDGNPVKLRFRRGRVIDIQSENNSPRRLKFRRGRVLGDNQNLKADGRRNFKRRGADGDVIDSKHDSGKLVLRHQDVHGRKDAQGLFNNVIEETASKLVETRKSKVKALVGAFETVISLQDGKPSANAAS